LIRFIVNDIMPDTTYAVATTTAVFRLRQQGVTVFFRCVGSFAANTTEIHGFFHPAGGEKARDADSINADCVSRVTEWYALCAYTSRRSKR
jgi:hypothetical protein